MRERLSPHHAARTQPISAIVLHDTGGRNAGSTLAWFEHTSSKVSAHYVIDKDGTTYRCVPDERVAWHAGTSTLHGQGHVNEFSLGIELVDDSDWEFYPDPQLDSVVDLCTQLCWDYRIPLNRIVGHQHIALPAGRKNDPGSDFPWFEVLSAIGARLADRLDEHVTDTR